jgi:SAM-dependent methyltransferase
MKRCLACNAHYTSSLTYCPACGFGPVLVNGFYAYAPEFSRAETGFKSIYFSDLARLEEANFWFRARNTLLIWALKHYGLNVHKFMEIGCGTGSVLKSIAHAFPSVQSVGSEIFPEGLAFAAERLGGRSEFLQMDARQIPYVAEFDAIGAFDVIEHIREDEAVLQQMHQALKPRGLLMLTVPQHPSLWSPVDEYSCHVRRYTARGLHEKVNCAGFEIIRSTSFVTTLLPLMFLSRLLQRGKSPEYLASNSELKIDPILNRILEYCLHFEVLLIRLGVSLPAGGSRLVIAIKR